MQESSRKSVVFIGDSITDCGRTYPTVSEYGYGFAAKCIERIRARFPGARLYNRGVAGECIGQIARRWEEDCLSLNPGLVTFLAGVNDVDYSYRKEDHPFIREALSKALEDMFASAKASGAKLVVLEPYAFDGELYKDAYAPRLAWLKEETARLAGQYADVYIRTQMRPEWTQEGVHPTPEGHEKLCGQWMDAAEAHHLLDFLAII